MKINEPYHTLDGIIEKLNIEAFELIKLVIEKPNSIPPKVVELVGSSKEKGFVDISDKIIGPSTERTTDHGGNTTSIFLINESGRFGFDETNFFNFKKLVKKLYSIKNLNQKLSLNFIETTSFQWIINVYEKQKAESSLFDYLMTNADESVKNYTFFFPVLNLEIEKKFKVGNVEFTFFTKEYFDKLLASLKEKNEDNYTQIFRKDFQGQVLAEIEIFAEKKKAEELAKQQAEIAVNILKIYSESAIIPEKKTMFDLNYKLGYQVQSNFLIQKSKDSDDLSLNLNFNNYPSNYSTKRYNLANKGGLNYFSDFLLLKKNDELYNIIIQSINLFGTAISNWDLHLRCITLITLLESIFLKEDEDYKMEHKTKTRLSKILSKKNEEKERIKSVFSSIYDVRHKMIHKGKRIDFDTKILSEAQMQISQLFLHLIQLNSKGGLTLKTNLIELIDKQKN